MEYTGKEHAQHLIQTLKPHYDVTMNWGESKFLSIDLKWNYEKHAVRLSMKTYIINLLYRLHHHNPIKPTHSPHKYQIPSYGAKQ